MLYELTNVSITLQKIINKTFYNSLDKFVLIYMNDILIYFEILKKYK